MTEISQYHPEPEDEYAPDKGNRQEGLGARLAGAAIDLVHRALSHLEGDS